MSLPETIKALVRAPVAMGNPAIKEFPLQMPSKDQVLVKMEYTTLGPYEIGLMKNVIVGPQHPKVIIGAEGSGVVVAVGEDLKTPYKVGDKVHVLSEGTYAQYHNFDTSRVSPIEHGLSMEEACAHLINPGTVHYIGSIAQKGGHKAIIQTGASSALGKQLIRYAKHLGIKTINVVRKDKYIEELKKEGATHVLNSEDKDFEATLKELAEKEHATLGVDCVGGEMASKIFRNLPAHSALYLFGNLSRDWVMKDVSIQEIFKGKSIQHLSEYDYFSGLRKDGIWSKTLSEIHSLLPTVFKTKVQKIYKLEEIEEAIPFYMQNAGEGKVLIKLN